MEVVESSVFQPKEGYPETVVFSDLDPASNGVGFKKPQDTAGFYVVTPSAISLKGSNTEAHGFRAAPLLTARNPWTLLDEGDAASSVVSLALERMHRSGSQRVVVVGDADFLTSGVAASREYAQRINSRFSALLMYWLTDSTLPVDTTRPPADDNRVGIQIHQIDYVRIALFGLLPIMLIVSSSGLLISRRRH